MRLLPQDVNCVLYHSPCSDGFTSALTAYLYFKNKDKHVEYIGVSHGSSPPDVVGKNVLICDFSYKKDILDQMIKDANNLLVIDHHITAKNDLSELDDVYKIFDMDHSGAVLTWNYFYPDKDAPLLYKYVEDRDLWKKLMPNTDAFVAWFYNLDFEFDIYEKYLDDELLLKCIETKGLAYLELTEINIKKIAEHCVPKFSKIKDKYYFISYINSNQLKSDVGSEIFNVYPNCSFSAVYSIQKYDRTSFSLRSTQQHEDVSAIAKCFGGGGHRNASGVSLNYVASTLPCNTYDNGELYNILENGCYAREYNITDDFLDVSGNMIFCNSNIYMKEIGKYLLQRRGEKQNGTWIVYKSIQVIDVAIIWTYKGKGEYNIEIIYDEELHPIKLDKLTNYINEQLSQPKNIFLEIN